MTAQGAAKLLSYLGLIPFIVGAVMAWATGGETRGWALGAVMVYAAVILSFIGAVHWGRIVTDPPSEPAAPTWLAWGVVPSLLGWVAVLLPLAVGLPLMIAGFVAAWAVDRWAGAVGILPGWYGTMRTWLSVIVSLALAALIPLS